MAGRLLFVLGFCLIGGSALPAVTRPCDQRNVKAAVEKAYGIAFNPHANQHQIAQGIELLTTVEYPCFNGDQIEALIGEVLEQTVKARAKVVADYGSFAPLALELRSKLTQSDLYAYATEEEKADLLMKLEDEFNQMVKRKLGIL